MGLLDRFKQNKGITRTYYDEEEKPIKTENYDTVRQLKTHLKSKINTKSIKANLRAEARELGGPVKRRAKELRREYAAYNPVEDLANVMGTSSHERPRRSKGRQAYSGYSPLEGSSLLNHEGLGVADVSEKRRQKERAYGDNLLGGFPSYSANMERGKKRKGRSSDLDWMY